MFSPSSSLFLRPFCPSRPQPSLTIYPFLLCPSLSQRGSKEERAPQPQPPCSCVISLSLSLSLSLSPERRTNLRLASQYLTHSALYINTCVSARTRACVRAFLNGWPDLHTHVCAYIPVAVCKLLLVTSLEWASDSQQRFSGSPSVTHSPTRKQMRGGRWSGVDGWGSGVGDRIRGRSGEMVEAATATTGGGGTQICRIVGRGTEPGLILGSWPPPPPP
jgi:hypothetical protein